VASLPEIVENGVSGFIVPPNDVEILHSRLKQIAENDDLRQAMGVAARERVLECFRWSSVVERCLEAYG
jgi:glycosyltransferase involved in cell wall biosynthesis